jgi:hypothetical protein
MMHLPWKCKSCRPLGMRTWKVRHSQSSVTSSSCGYLSLLGRWAWEALFHLPSIPAGQSRAEQSNNQATFQSCPVQQHQLQQRQQAQ